MSNSEIGGRDWSLSGSIEIPEHADRSLPPFDPSTNAHREIPADDIRMTPHADCIACESGISSPHYPEPNPHCGYSLTACQALHHDGNVDD